MASAMADAGVPAWKLVFNAGTQLHGATSPFLLQPNDSESKSVPVRQVEEEEELRSIAQQLPNVPFLTS